MARKHVENPFVTVIMETVGLNADKMPRAVESFLGQTYERAKLLIVNYHPQRLQLSGVPKGARIEIANEDDVFLRRVHQHAHNLKMVDSDCWTVLDDDDWMEPDHLRQLADAWNGQENRTDAPLRVCGQNYLAHYDDGVVRPIRFQGWAVSLFERLSPDEVDWCFNRFPAEQVLGSDTWIAGCSYFDRREFEGRATYHWDRTGSRHVSQHESNRGRTARDRFDQALRYWELKSRARARDLAPVVLYQGEKR